MVYYAAVYGGIMCAAAAAAAAASAQRGRGLRLYIMS